MIGHRHGRTAIWIAVAATALLGAWSAAVDAYAAYVRAADPERAYAQRPHDAMAMGRALGLRVKQGNISSITMQDVENGRLGLRTEPLAYNVFKVFGFYAALQGNQAKADVDMGMANRLSKRDSFTQIWLIERAVEKSDIRSALMHYDAVLSVHPEMGAQLYPILAGAIAETDIRAALRPYIARQARWIGDFVDTAITVGRPQDVALLLLANANNIHVPAFEKSIANLLTALVEAGNLTLANRVAVAMVPGYKAVSMRTLAMDEHTSDQRLGALSWTLPQTSGIDAAGNGLGGFDITASPFSHGVVAMRVVGVEPGRAYRFSYTLGNNAGAQMADGRWTISCVPQEAAKTPLLEHPLLQRSGQDPIEINIAVPSDCLALRFALEIKGGEGQQASQVSIRSLDLRMI